MALIPSQILRVAILLSYFSVLCNYKAIDMPAHQTYGGSWKFLTFINLVSENCPILSPLQYHFGSFVTHSVLAKIVLKLFIALS